MDQQYLSVAEHASKYLTNKYSTSFGTASKLFPDEIRQHIYNIYGLVRIADEIVDTYEGKDAMAVLDALELEVYEALKRMYSANIIVQSFVHTANTFGIKKDLIAPFFISMRYDSPQHVYKTKEYSEYIYGSAEVVGLMCLKVFCNGDTAQYKQLEPGARALGSAFQKVNFLRDIKDDYERLGRYYFPVGSFDSFDDATKTEIIRDIQKDFAIAKDAISRLPRSAKLPVTVAYEYYLRLLTKLDAVTAEQIKQERIRVPDLVKLWLLIRVRFGLL